MKCTLFGSYPDAEDYAQKIVSFAMTEGKFRKIQLNKFTDREISYYILDEDNCSLKKPEYGGLYSLYLFKDNKPEFCLYVGSSSSNIGYRIYRFVKELLNKSRDDENHPGAKKARNAGIKITDDIRVMYFSWEDLPNPPEKCIYDPTRLDESVARLLKSKFNKRKS